MIFWDLRNKIRTDTVPAALTCAIGNFDGVHTGHRALLEETLSVAGKTGTESAVFTFETNTSKAAPILTGEEKERLFAALSLRYMILCPFEEVRTLTPEAFVKDILFGKCRVVSAVCGFNFRFGFGGVGTPETLCELMKKSGGEACTVPPVEYGGQAVSSTRIRCALCAGDMKSVNAMLGRSYEISGTVLHGRHLGTSLGFPTANLALSPAVLSPKSGVYASLCRIDGKEYPAVSNIGARPTVEEKGRPNCETNVIGYEGDLYGKTISVYPIAFLREETKFSSLEELSAAVKRDREAAVALLIKKE